jgi:phosphinothricin acetyltransferase
MTTIRDAHVHDAPALAAIYGHHVLHGLGTFEETPPDADEMGRRLRSVNSFGLPYLVAVADERVLGFAYAGPFRLRSAYRFTVEDSVYIAPDAIGQGVGRALLSQVVGRCEALGMRQIVAVIGDSGNAASIGLHGDLGFERTGIFTAVGHKHGRWVDVVFMQKALNGGDSAPPLGSGLLL